MCGFMFGWNECMKESLLLIGGADALLKSVIFRVSDI